MISSSDQIPPDSKGPVAVDISPSASIERSLARDSVGTTLTNLVLFVLGLIIWIAVARILDPAWRGVLALVMILPATVMKLGTFGFDYGIIVLGGEHHERLPSLRKSGAEFGAFMSLVFVVLLIGFMWAFPMTFWRIMQEIWNPEAFIAISLAFPLHLVTMSLDASIYAEDRIAARNAKEFTVSLIMLVTLLVMVLLGFKLFAVIGAYLLANFVSRIYAGWLVGEKINSKWVFVYRDLKDSIKLGFPVYLANLASFIMLPTMMLLLSFMLTGKTRENLAQIAFFTMAFQMVDRILPMTRSIAFALLPKITSGSDKVASELAAKSSRHTLLASLALFIVLVIFMKPLVIFLLGPRYLPVVIPFLILAPAGVVLSVAGVWSAHLLARHKPLVVAQAGIAGVVTALIVAIIGFWALPSGREVIIAATSVVIGDLVNTLVLFASFCRIGGISPSDALVPRADDVREWKRIPGFLLDLISRKTRT